MDNKRKLIWKYFWKRKRGEVKDFLIGFLKTSFVLCFIVSGMVSFMSLIALCAGMPMSPAIISYVAVVIFLGECLMIGICQLIKWLRSNWKLATKDAITELKRKEEK